MPMPEGERPPFLSPDSIRQKIPPNPVTRTDNGFLRRRDDPHGLSLRERAALGFDRTLKRVENEIGRITDPPEAASQAGEAIEQESTQINGDEVKLHNAPIEPQPNSEEDPLRFGSDLPPITVRFMRAANRVGEFFQRHFATPLLGEPSHQPLVRRPEFQYPHEMKVQRSTSAPSSIRVIEQKPEPPYDWADRKNGSSEFQDNPVIDTTEAIPTKADESS